MCDTTLPTTRLIGSGLNVPLRMPSGIRLRLSFSNKFVKQPSLILDLHLLDLLLPTICLRLLYISEHLRLPGYPLAPFHHLCLLFGAVYRRTGNNVFYAEAQHKTERGNCNTMKRLQDLNHLR